jgi:hypothetical protein
VPDGVSRPSLGDSGKSSGAGSIVMKSYTIPEISLPAFEVPTDAENYWNERYCYEQLKWMMGMQSMVITQNETSDYTALDGWWATQRGEIEASLAEGGDREIANNLPALATLVTNFLGVSSGAGLFFAKIAIWVLFKWLEGKNVENETEDLEKLIKKAMTYKIDLEGDDDDLDNRGAFLELLINPKYHILLEQQRGSMVESVEINQGT